MTTIIFLTHDGQRHAVEARDGQSVMEAALANLVPGILADCGGSCNCATCHAYVDAERQAALPAPDEGERMMLEGVLEPRPQSRLTCQLVVAPELAGAVFELPERQC